MLKVINVEAAVLARLSPLQRLRQRFLWWWRWTPFAMRPLRYWFRWFTPREDSDHD